MELQFQMFAAHNHGDYIGQQPYWYVCKDSTNNDDETGSYARFTNSPPKEVGTWTGDAYSRGWYGALEPCADIAHDTMEDRGLYILSLYRNGMKAEFKAQDAGLINQANFEKLWHWAINNQPQRDVTVKIEL